MNKAILNIYGNKLGKYILDCLSYEFDIASFDCATDNMGVVSIRCLIPCIIPNTRGVLKYHNSVEVIMFLLSELELLVDNLLRLTYYDKWKLTPQIKLKTSMTSIILANLKKYIIENISAPKHALYEYQMGHNVKTGHIQDGIIYHFALTETILTKMGATLKNTLMLSDELKIQNFYAQYTKSYDANKAHSEASFIYWCTIFGIPLRKFLLVKPTKTRRYEKLDDIADAWAQILAAIKYNKF